MYAGVVVLYNPKKEEINYNISTYINELDKLYIVDNSSEDNNSIFTGLDSNKIDYIPNYDNLGISGALNIGANKAIADGHEWLLTMDQDSHFDSNSLKMMKAYIEFSQKTTEKLGIVSPFHLTPRSEDIIHFNLISYPIVVMTSGNFVNLKAYVDVKGYIDWYFIDCVDFDFCMHLKKKDYEIVQINTAVLNHELGETVKKKVLGKTIFVDNHNYIRRYYMIRNRFYFLDKYQKQDPYYCKIEKKSTVKEIISVLLYENDKKRKLSYMYKGYKDYKNGLGGRIDKTYPIKRGKDVKCETKK